MSRTSAYSPVVVFVISAMLGSSFRRDGGRCLPIRADELKRGPLALPFEELFQRVSD